MQLDIKDITKNYKMGTEIVAALRGVSVNLLKNEYMAIMGPSGSGKSTLMNIIGCLDTPSAGSYLLEGADVSKMDDDQLAEIRNQKIGFVFQTFNLIPRADVFHNVELPMVYSGLSSAKRKKLAEEAIEKVGLTDRMKHKPSELSDSSTGAEIMSVLDQLHQAGNTIILVTHENDIAEHANRVIKLKDGLVESDELNHKHFAA
jgi:putative ABC transport system ATP-binding protein